MVMCMFSMCKVRNNFVHNETYTKDSPRHPIYVERSGGYSYCSRLSLGEEYLSLGELISEDDALRGRDEDDALALYSLRAWGEVRDGST